MSFSQSASQVKVSSRMYLWCGWWSLLIPCNDTSASLMCYASHLVTIFVWARLSSCVFPGSSGSVASAKGYMTEWEGGRRYWMPLQLLKLHKMSFSSIFAEATFSLFATLSHYKAERWQRNHWRTLGVSAAFYENIFLMLYYFKMESPGLCL